MADLIEVLYIANVAKKHAYMTAKGIIDVYQGRPFSSSIANFGKVNIHLPKHQSVGEAAEVPVERAHIKNERSSYLSAAHRNYIDSSVNSVRY